MVVKEPQSLIAGVRGHEARQAQLTFAMARHAMVDLAQVLSLRPVSDAPDRLPPERYEQLYNLLCQSGVKVCRDGQSIERLRELRVLYEGHATSLADHLQMALPPWIADHPHKDNWQTVARLRAQTDAANADPSGKVASGEASPDSFPAIVDHQHDF